MGSSSPRQKFRILYGHHAVTWLINLIVYFWTKRKSGGAARGWGPQLRRFICRTLRAHTKLQATHVIILKQILWCLIFCNEIERSKHNMKRKRFLFFLTIKEPITLPSRVTANTLSAWKVITSNRLVKSVRNVNCTIHKFQLLGKSRKWETNILCSFPHRAGVLLNFKNLICRVFGPCGFCTTSDIMNQHLFILRRNIIW